MDNENSGNSPNQDSEHGPIPLAPWSMGEFVAALERLCAVFAAGLDENARAKSPFDGDHTNNDNQRNRPRDRIELHSEKDPAICVVRLRGEGYYVTVCGVQVLVMDQQRRFGGRPAGDPLQLRLWPEQSHQLGLMWSTASDLSALAVDAVVLDAQRRATPVILARWERTSEEPPVAWHTLVSQSASQRGSDRKRTIESRHIDDAEGMPDQRTSSRTASLSPRAEDKADEPGDS